MGLCILGWRSWEKGEEEDSKSPVMLVHLLVQVLEERLALDVSYSAICIIPSVVKMQGVSCTGLARRTFGCNVLCSGDVQS